MASRNIRKIGDELLRKKSKKIEKIDDRLQLLLDDMLETMYANNGVGLAAPQVGILKRVVVIDIGEGPVFLINPEITKAEGSYIDEEGCLSIPGEQGEVERPYRVTVKALDRNGNEVVIEGEELMARALCHEIDHLNGVLFVDKIIKEDGR